jgi:peptidoglycan hydrolase-like protein with peptidoglycan-binding domain
MLYKGDPRLEACLVQDSAHVQSGASGDHVFKIQTALILLDDLKIARGELAAKTYGPSTAAAVRAFKKKRNIINWTYQTQADDIVGKMTIAALDNEISQWEQQTPMMAMKSCGCPRVSSILQG